MSDSIVQLLTYGLGPVEVSSVGLVNQLAHLICTTSTAYWLVHKI